MKVVFVIIDALPNRLVNEELTPNLWQLAMGGGWNPRGGRAVLSTATYPNHATFATGRLPDSHGIFSSIRCGMMRNSQLLPRLDPRGTQFS